MFLNNSELNIAIQNFRKDRVVTRLLGFLRKKGIKKCQIRSCSASYFSKILSYKTDANPSLYMLFSIAEELNVSAAYILCGENSSEKTIIPPFDKSITYEFCYKNASNLARDHYDKLKHYLDRTQLSNFYNNRHEKPGLQLFCTIATCAFSNDGDYSPITIERCLSSLIFSNSKE